MGPTYYGDIAYLSSDILVFAWTAPQTGYTLVELMAWLVVFVSFFD